jgi:hypothetical protein
MLKLCLVPKVSCNNAHLTPLFKKIGRTNLTPLLVILNILNRINGYFKQYILKQGQLLLIVYVERKKILLLMAKMLTQKLT